MIVILICLGAAGLIGYLWAARGFFSAFLHLVCVICAGAIAFGLWEPLTYVLLASADHGRIVDVAWGLTLAVTYSLSLAIVSAIVNAVIRANVKVAPVTDWIGGFACGIAAGVLTVGMAMLAAQAVRGPKALLTGLAAVDFDRDGSVIREKSALDMVRPDKLTAGLFSYLSLTSLRTSTPLGEFRPALADALAANRLVPDEMILKNALRPGDVDLLARYTVGRVTRGESGDKIVGDKKPVKDLDGETLSTREGYVEGVLVGFRAGAREKNGQVVISPGQIQLVVRNVNGDAMTLFPFAMVSQAKGDNLYMGRWRFDSKNVFLASVGGGADPRMTFEFYVPRVEPAWEPLAIYVKGLRLDLTTQDESGQAAAIAPSDEFATFAEYNSARETRDLMRLAAPEAALDETAKKSTTNKKNTNPNDQFSLPLRDSNSLGQSVRLIKGNLRGISVNDKREIVDGEGQFSNKELADRGIERTLIVDKFLPGDSTVIVQVDASRSSAWSILAEEASGAVGGPFLLDTRGQRYECIGWVYKDSAKTWVRFTPGRPITSTDELPPLSRNVEGQKLELVFRVSFGTEVKQFGIGTKVLHELSPPYKLATPQISR